MHPTSGERRTPVTEQELIRRIELARRGPEMGTPLTGWSLAWFYGIAAFVAIVGTACGDIRW